MQGVWAALLALSGTYSELLDYVVFAQLLFYVLTVGAVFVLRASGRTTPRPYRAWGYPYVPAAYIVAAVALMARPARGEAALHVARTADRAERRAGLCDHGAAAEAAEVTPDEHLRSSVDTCWR